MPTYDFHSDPGHGWLKVDGREIVRLGIQDEISEFSYMRNGYAYLEKDCDCGVFAKALDRLGVEFKTRNHYSEKNSGIRSYDSYDAVRFVKDVENTWRGEAELPPYQIMPERCWWNDQHKSSCLEDAKSLAESTLLRLGLIKPAWERRESAKGWEFAKVRVGTSPVLIGASPGGFVSVNGDPFILGEPRRIINCESRLMTAMEPMLFEHRLYEWYKAPPNDYGQARDGKFLTAETFAEAGREHLSTSLVTVGGASTCQEANAILERDPYKLDTANDTIRLALETIDWTQVGKKAFEKAVSGQGVDPDVACETICSISPGCVSLDGQEAIKDYARREGTSLYSEYLVRQDENWNGL
jgi:hypothetical protein